MRTVRAVPERSSAGGDRATVSVAAPLWRFPVSVVVARLDTLATRPTDTVSVTE